MRAEVALANPAIEETLQILRALAQRLDNILQEECFMAETPIEVEAELDSASKTIGHVLQLLDPSTLRREYERDLPRSLPTRRQGQFLAFIRQYMLLNARELAPTHAELQKFFNLTPPSVNSMLIRLEQRGFIRRVPGKARAIELTINPNLIPPLSRPHQF